MKPFGKSLAQQALKKAARMLSRSSSKIKGDFPTNRLFHAFGASMETPNRKRTLSFAVAILIATQPILIKNFMDDFTEYVRQKTEGNIKIELVQSNDDDDDDAD
jgi:hypothetical protein